MPIVSVSLFGGRTQRKKHRLAEAVYELRKAELKDKEVDIIDEPTAGQLLNNLYRNPYESAIDKMLHFFLPKVSELHLKAQDSDILYREIAKLFLKMLLQPGIQDLKKSANQKLNDCYDKRRRHKELCKLFSKIS
jgi:hypothetical protein